MNKTGKRILSAVLAAVMLFCLTAVSASAKESKMNIVLLDAGRKYFSPAQIERIIDRMAEDGYTDLELGVANDGCRFLLDDMSLKANGVSYSDAQVRQAILNGDEKYYDDPNGTALSQSEMDQLFSYAKGKGIRIIPLMESPGHMAAIVYAMQELGTKEGEPKINARTGNISMNIESAKESNFVRALLFKYMKYFAGKGCEWFNMGCDEVSGYMPKDGKYDLYLSYVNCLAKSVKYLGMKPIMFNDILYYDGNGEGEVDPDIAVAYWNVPAGSVQPAATTETIRKNGHALFNHNCMWYYVIGNNESPQSISYNPFTYALSKASMRTLHYTSFSDGTKYDGLLGACISFWCDTPQNTYKESLVLNLIDTFDEENPEYFTPVA